MTRLNNINNKSITDFDISIISDPHVLARELIGPSERFIKELKVERKLVV